MSSWEYIEHDILFVPASDPAFRERPAVGVSRRGKRWRGHLNIDEWRKEAMYGEESLISYEDYISDLGHIALITQWPLLTACSSYAASPCRSSTGQAPDEVRGSADADEPATSSVQFSRVGFSSLTALDLALFVCGADPAFEHLFRASSMRSQ